MIGEGKLTREEIKELFTLKKSLSSTYDLIRKKNQEDGVWKEFDKSREFKDSVINSNREMANYIAEEVEMFVEEKKEEKKEEEKEDLEFEKLDISDDEFL